MGSGIVKKFKALFDLGIRLAMKITGFSERFVLFLVMGGVNTAFSYSLYSLLIYSGVYYPVAVVVSTVCGVLFNFQTFGRVVFKDFRLRLLGRFFGVYAIVCGTNIAGLKLLEMAGLVDKYIAGAVLILPMAMLGYTLNRTFVFNRKEPEAGNRPLPTGDRR